MRRIAFEFGRLQERGARTGYIDLVRPPSFEEQVEEQRCLRDMEEENGDTDAERRARFQAAHAQVFDAHAGTFKKLAEHG